MVSLSYNGTLAKMKRLANNFDKDVVSWANNLREKVNVQVSKNLHLNYNAMFDTGRLEEKNHSYMG